MARKTAAPAPKKKTRARKPRDLSKIPDAMLTDAERKQKEAAAKAESAKQKEADRERNKKTAAKEYRAVNLFATPRT